MWFQGALKDKSVKVIGDGNNHLPPIHVEDLADSYLRAAESGLGGELFLLADASTATAKQMATAAAKAAGYHGEVQLWPVADAAKVMGVWVEGLGLDSTRRFRRSSPATGLATETPAIRGGGRDVLRGLEGTPERLSCLRTARRANDSPAGRRARASTVCSLAGLASAAAGCWKRSWPRSPPLASTPTSSRRSG